MMVIIVVVASTAALTQLFLLDALLQVHFCVSFLLIRSSKLATARVTAERLFASMSPNVSGQVIGSREGPHADATLERLLTGVDSDVAGELVGA